MIPTLRGVVICVEGALDSALTGGLGRVIGVNAGLVCEDASGTLDARMREHDDGALFRVGR